MSPKKILVVDDEESIVHLCQRVLVDEGYLTSGASSGFKAVEISAKDRFHMVITDLRMPGMDGMDTFLALRQKQPEIIGVMITAHGTVDTAIEAMGQGLSSFIRKPFIPQELIQVVKDAFQRSAVLEENTRLKSLLPLYDLGEKFIQCKSREEILDELIETLSGQTGAQRVSVMLYDKKEDCLRIAASKNLSKNIIEKTRLKPGEKIAGSVFQQCRPVIINGGPENNPNLKAYLKSKNIVAAILFPLGTKDRPLGVLNISKIGTGTPFSESDVDMIAIVCRQAGMALENLNAMDERVEKARIRTLLEQYLAPEVTETLMSRGEDLLEFGEIKNVVILFADIRNFTPLVSQIPLQVIRAFLNDFFGLFSDLIFKSKGTMDKFLGDAVLAFFGAPVPIPEPGITSVESAIMMHRAFEDLKKTWLKERKEVQQIGLGIGISSGEVFLGNVGSKRRLDYTVIGKDVNIAQRLSVEAASGEILVTKQVQDTLDTRFRILDETSRILKGMEQAIPVFSMEGNSHYPGIIGRSNALESGEFLKNKNGKAQEKEKDENTWPV